MYSVKIICFIATLLLLLNSIHCANRIDINVLQQIINQLNEAQQASILQSLLQNSNQDRQDNSNWCCSIDPGKRIPCRHLIRILTFDF